MASLVSILTKCTSDKNKRFITSFNSNRVSTPKGVNEREQILCDVNEHGTTLSPTITPFFKCGQPARKYMGDMTHEITV
jgi:hypothetical protein